MKKLFTIGYTKKSLEDFVNLIMANKIEKIIDIRLKNSSQLAGFAKANDLKYILEKFLDIGYSHVPLLSPSEEIFNEYRKTRNWDQYVKSFNMLMNKRKMDIVLKDAIANHDRVCLLCSEELPNKCHRRLLAEYYKSKGNQIEIKHLTKKDLKNIDVNY
ncbi:MAG: DUF488 domain-containing protein [Candidatus Thermoplasmatota archaeon]|nr:DUF488 domain-containing protein [Candidatus Thermoplasmatota archaeon]